MRRNPLDPTRWTLFAWLLAAALTAVAADAPETPVERAEAVRADATVTSSQRASATAPPEVVEALIDHPELAADLWNAFAKTPAYAVEMDAAGRIHLEDPTGISADGQLLARHGSRRTYLADGRFDHWAVRGLSRATAVIDVEVSGTESGGTEVAVEIFVKADKWVSDVALSALKAAIEKRVEARIRANLDDAAHIVDAIARTPRGVASKLEGAPRRQFKELFIPVAEEPARAPEQEPAAEPETPVEAEGGA